MTQTTTDLFFLENEDGPLIFSEKWGYLEPDTRPGAKPGDFELIRTFGVEWKALGEVYRLRAPKGLRTDIASIPRIVWTLSGLTPDGLYRNAAIFHDIIFMWQGKFPPGWFQKLVNGSWVDVEHPWSFTQANKFFLRVMKACGVDKATRKKMFWAVQIFGWFAWIKTDKSREQYREAFVNGSLGG